ncbi:MAG: kelch repeat-containing protein, partial [Myxococcota bacterium]
CGSLAPVTLLGGACVSQDVWTWDGSEWDSVCDAACQGAGPNQRLGSTAAYDPVSDRVVLFGGRDVSVDDGMPLDVLLPNDTWTWDGAEWTQVQAPSIAREPRGRSFGNMVYSPAQGGLLLFSGCTEANDLFNCNDISDPIDSVWRWTGSEWELFDTLPDDVLPRTGAMAVADTGRGEVIWAGGATKLTDKPPMMNCDELDVLCPDGRPPLERGEDACMCFLDGTELGRGTSELEWTLESGNGGLAPTVQQNPVTVRVPGSDLMFMTGGEDRSTGSCDGNGRSGCDTLWQYDRTWSRVWEPTVTGRDYDNGECGVVINGFVTEPCPVDQGALGFVQEGSDRAIALFGQSRAQCDPPTDCAAYYTWLYPLDGGEDWVTIGDEDSIPPRPARRDAPGFASVRMGENDWDLFVFGGFLRLSNSISCPAESTGEVPVADDPGEKYCLFDTVWRLSVDGGVPQWSPVTVSGPAPPFRINPGVTYDPTGGRIYMFGGCTDVGTECENSDGSGALADLWEFDPMTSQWSELVQNNPPSSRAGAALAFDSERQRLLLFGGTAIDGPGDNTFWSYNPSTGDWIEREQEGVAP